MGHIKEWEELTISDNFLFQKVMQKEELCKRLIEMLLGIKVKRIIYADVEKVLEASPTQKGIRLDLYVEIEDGTIIDIEIQTTDGSRTWLPKRSRYYQAIIDLNTLAKGKDYTVLRKSFVIFICTFDPFPGNDRKVYTFKNYCREQKSLEFGDETVKIFLNTKGTIGEVCDDLDKLLAYIDGKSAEGEFTQEVAAEAERLKKHEDTRLEYMSIMLALKDQRREGREEGYNEGLLDGEKNGEKKRIDGLVSNVSSLIDKKGWSLNETLDNMGVAAEDRDLVIARMAPSVC